MKKTMLSLLLATFTASALAQGDKGAAKECAPIVEGKVVYQDQVEVSGKSDAMIFDAINTWAKETYAQEFFSSNYSSNQDKGLIKIFSTVDLPTDDGTTVRLTYHMTIKCMHHRYSIEATKLKFQIAPEGKKMPFKKHPAEEILANNGKSNTQMLIKDAELLCNATYFLMEDIFADIYSAASSGTQLALF